MSFRAMFAVLLISIFVIRLYYHRKARTWERGIVNVGPGWLPGAQVALALASLGIILTYLIAPQRIAWADVALPDFIRWTGAGFGVVSLALLTWVNRELAENFSTVLRIRQGHTLITTGPYRFVRHPMYSVFVLMCMGFGLLSANWLMGAMTLGAVSIVMVFRTPLEEKMLLDFFGEQYRAYMQRTGRYFPRIATFRRDWASAS